MNDDRPNPQPDTETVNHGLMGTNPKHPDQMIALNLNAAWTKAVQPELLLNSVIDTCQAFIAEVATKVGIEWLNEEDSDESDEASVTDTVLNGQGVTQ